MSKLHVYMTVVFTTDGGSFVDKVYANREHAEARRTKLTGSGAKYVKDDDTYITDYHMHSVGIIKKSVQGIEELHLRSLVDNHPLKFLVNHV